MTGIEPANRYAMTAENVKGYLVIDVVEASGKSRDDAYVWDSTAFEGFVKGECIWNAAAAALAAARPY